MHIYHNIVNIVSGAVTHLFISNLMPLGLSVGVSSMGYNAIFINIWIANMCECSHSIPFLNALVYFSIALVPSLLLVVLHASAAQLCGVLVGPGDPGHPAV